MQVGSRYGEWPAPRVADGWSLQRATPYSRLYSANGIRIGPDRRLYVAQVSGSQISAVDVDSGAIEVVSPMGSDIVAPDDLDFDRHGNIYVTEFMEGRVSILAPNGATRVLRGDLPGVNGITFVGDRLFVDECRMGGRVLELDPNGEAPRVLAEDVPLPNALAAGPDGKLYFPVIGTDEIWRIDPDAGRPERFAGGQAHPVAVKFDPTGALVALQARTGEVQRIDVCSGARSVVTTLTPGLDNLDFLGDRLFVSHLTDGRITEIAPDGGTRTLVPGGLQRPMGLAAEPGGGLLVADNVAFYRLATDGTLTTIGRMFTPGYPGGIRGVATTASGRVAVTTTCGKVAMFDSQTGSFRVVASGLDQVYGLACTDAGVSIVAEFGRGRILAVDEAGVSVVAEGLGRPIDVALTAEGAILVAEAGAGRIVELAGSRRSIVLDGLIAPHGIATWEGELFVVDAGARSVLVIDLADRHVRTIAERLPIGPPPGVVAKPLKGSPPFVGPLGPFAGLTVTPAGDLHLAADGEGSVLSLRRDAAGRR